MPEPRVFHRETRLPWMVRHRTRSELEKVPAPDEPLTIQRLQILAEAYGNRPCPVRNLGLGRIADRLRQTIGNQGKGLGQLARR